jgi:dTDP-4-dehydrorhamnose reductase
MRALVLGGGGMLGHKLWQESRDRLDACATIRASRLEGPLAAVLDPDRTVTGVMAEDPSSVQRAIEQVEPEVVFNCIGIVKQAPQAVDPVASIRVNSLFPHQLAELCRARGARLVQVSTDCIFSGSRGGYTEEDPPDAPDLYGRSKLLGELEGEGCLTIRTSIVGRELTGGLGLVEWLISQRGGEAPGFTQAIFSGLTTRALAAALCDLIATRPDLQGVWHLSAEPISKHDLLAAIRDAMNLDVRIVPDDSVAIDRSLDSTRLRETVGWSPPSWPEMIQGLVFDETPYEELRRGDAGG